MCGAGSATPSTQTVRTIRTQRRAPRGRLRGRGFGDGVGVSVPVQPASIDPPSTCASVVPRRVVGSYAQVSVTPGAYTPVPRGQDYLHRLNSVVPPRMMLSPDVLLEPGVCQEHAIELTLRTNNVDAWNRRECKNWIETVQRTTEAPFPLRSQPKRPMGSPPSPSSAARRLQAGARRLATPRPPRGSQAERSATHQAKRRPCTESQPRHPRAVFIPG